MNQNLEDWKKEYYKNLKKENAKNKRVTYIALLVIAILSLVFYFWYKGELKFLGKETQFAKAIITDIRYSHLGRGYYKQVVSYEFEFNETKYTGSFRAGQKEGYQYTGDYVKIKFAVDDPNISLYIGTYKSDQTERERPGYLLGP